MAGRLVERNQMTTQRQSSRPCHLENPVPTLQLRVCGLIGLGLRPPDSVNIAIELHDSIVAGIAKHSGEVVVHFLPAYLHKSEGRPGIDPGTGWVQEARLIFADALTGGAFPGLPCTVMEGELAVGAERYENEVPVPLVVIARTELRLVFDAMHTVTVTGRAVRLELLGEPRYVEEFTP